MLFAGDPLFVDGKRDLAIAQQTSADVVVIAIYAEYVDVVLTHRSAPAGGFARSLHAIALVSPRSGASTLSVAVAHPLGHGRARAWLICAPNKPRDDPMRSRSERVSSFAAPKRRQVAGRVGQISWRRSDRAAPDPSDQDEVAQLGEAPRASGKMLGVPIRL